MGWLYSEAQFRKNGKIDKIAECRSQIRTDHQVLLDKMVGSTYYAAVRKPEDNSVIALVILTAVDKNQFGTKFLSEFDGPTESKCPLAILNLLSPTEEAYAVEWRKRCYKNIEQHQFSLGSLLPGSEVQFVAKGVTYTATKRFFTVYLDASGRIERISTKWMLSYPAGMTVSSQIINSWGYTVIHSATKEEAEEERAKRLSKIHGRIKN